MFVDCSLCPGVSETLHERLIDTTVDDHVNDMSPSEFELLLTFIYTGHNCFHGVDKCCLGVYVADRYGVTKLGRECLDRLNGFLEVDRQLDDYSAALQIIECNERFSIRQDNESLFSQVDGIIAQHLNCIIQSDWIARFQHGTLMDLLKLQSNVHEVELFHAVKRWADAQDVVVQAATARQEMVGELLAHVRFPLMTTHQLAFDVAKSGLLDDSTVLKLIRKSLGSTDEEDAVVYSEEPRQREDGATAQQVMSVETTFTCRPS